MSETGRCLPCLALKYPIGWEHFDFVIGACSYSVKTRGVLEDEEPNSPPHDYLTICGSKFGLTNVKV